MKTKDLREKSVEELKALLDEQRSLINSVVVWRKQLVSWVNRMKCKLLVRQLLVLRHSLPKNRGTDNE